MNNIKSLLVLIPVGLFLFSCNSTETKNATSTNSYAATQYVGEQACIQCHKTAYNDWKGSHHDWAMKLPNDTTILGDFNNASFSVDGENYLFFKKDSSYYVKTGVSGKEVEYEIAHTFGVTPLQQYLIKFPDGKMQTLRATWDTQKNEWFNQYAGQEIPTNDFLHWSKGGQRWNTMCAECHSTNLKKNYNQAKDAFATTYDNITVSCEACHGPAGAHLSWAATEKPTGNPQIKSVGSTQVDQINQCAGCHARRVKLTEVMQPGVAFDNQFMLQTISAEYYHPDGQIKEEDYVMGSFAQSKMFAKGVKCADCHNVHSSELKLQGNALCMQCHEPAYNSEAHHFHKGENESTQCVSCHMTGALFMGNDFRRDHSFRIPRPDQSEKYNTPNACIGCHQEKSDKWAANWINKWYSEERADHFSDHLLIASQPPYNDRARAEVLQFITNLNYPAIARATALEYYPLNDTEQEFEMLLTALKDSSALVRYNALAKFQRYPLDQKASFAFEHMNDETKLVRIGAAQLIAELDLAQVKPAQREKAQEARNEMVEMFRANADFPLGRLQLGDFYYKQKNIPRAIKEYEMALRMDSLLSPVYANLATAYSVMGDNKKALETLTALIKIEPSFGRAYYLRGLLQYEEGANDLAINDLRESIKLDPANFRAYYNLANLYFIMGNANAEHVMLQGLQIQPNSQEGILLLKLIQSKK